MYSIWEYTVPLFNCATVTGVTHQPLSDEEENIDRVQTVADVLPVWSESHYRLGVSPWQVIVVITCAVQNKYTQSF